MSPDAGKLLEEALRLSPAERATLAGGLIESLDQKVDEDAEAAWSNEISRRVKELDRGAVATIPWAEVRRRILAGDHGSP